MLESLVCGGIAFIGNSDAYGEQWLYSKFDYSILKRPIIFYMYDLKDYQDIVMQIEELKYED